MGNAWKLRKVKDRLIEDLKETTLSFRRLGKKYGVSRQAIFAFCDSRGIKRPTRPKIEHMDGCAICKSLIKIAKRPHSDFISSKTINAELKIGDVKRRYHLRILRRRGLISQKFGRLRSKKREQAYRLYFEEGLPVSIIERKTGLKNLHTVIAQQRTWGWTIPEGSFRYAKKNRRMAA